MNIGTEIFAIFVLIILNGVFALSEIAVVSSRKARLQQRINEDGDEGAKAALKLTENPNIFLSTVQVGITLIGVLAAVFSPVATVWTVGIWVTLAGFLGGLFDSFLGATVQAIYHCPTCNKETEHYPMHTCGTATSLKRGWDWLNNDLVNLGCSVFAIIFVLFF